MSYGLFGKIHPPTQLIFCTIFGFHAKTTPATCYAGNAPKRGIVTSGLEPKDIPKLTHNIPSVARGYGNLIPVSHQCMQYNSAKTKRERGLIAAHSRVAVAIYTLHTPHIGGLAVVYSQQLFRDRVRNVFLSTHTFFSS